MPPRVCGTFEYELQDSVTPKRGFEPELTDILEERRLCKLSPMDHLRSVSCQFSSAQPRHWVMVRSGVNDHHTQRSTEKSIPVNAQLDVLDVAWRIHSRFWKLEPTIMTWAPPGKAKYGEFRDVVSPFPNNA